MEITNAPNSARKARCLHGQRLFAPLAVGKIPPVLREAVIALTQKPAQWQAEESVLRRLNYPQKRRAFGARLVAMRSNLFGLSTAGPDHSPTGLIVDEDRG
jgi:hypothetical protein